MASSIPIKRAPRPGRFAITRLEGARQIVTGKMLDGKVICAHTSNGGSRESFLKTTLPAFRPSIFKLDHSSDVFTWDPF